MAQFASDAFTNAAGTALPTHDAAWALHVSYTGSAVITDVNSARTNTAAGTGALYYHSGAPATADYTVTADLLFKDANGGNGIAGVVGRVDTAANTMYMARYAGLTSDAWQLYKFVAGTATLLGSSAAAITDETSHNVKLEMVGSAIKLFKSGEGTAAVSVTDTAITAAGKSGIFVYNSANANNTSGIQVDTFSADDVSSGITAALTGQSITVAQGSTVAAITAPLTGQSIPLAQGTVTVDPGGISAALTGQSASVALGNVSPVVTVAISGQSIPLSLGTMVPAFERAITGQGVTASLGSVVAAVAPALSGQAITASTGTVSVGGDIVRALTGQSLTVEQGNVAILAASNDATGGYYIRLPHDYRRKRKQQDEPEVEPVKTVKRKAKKKPETYPSDINKLSPYVPALFDVLAQRQAAQMEYRRMYNIRARAALLAA